MPVKKKIELKNIPIANVTPYARNPRKNDPAVQHVAASLKEFGLVKNSIVVDENMVLITGHTTMKAMQSLGWTEVPEVTQVYGLTEAQKKAYRIADNRLGEDATWDGGLLAAEIDELRDLDFDLTLTGFDEKEIAALQDAEVKQYAIDDFVFTGPDKPCWFTIRADQEDYSELREELAAIVEKYNARMEASGDHD